MAVTSSVTRDRTPFGSIRPTMRLRPFRGTRKSRKTLRGAFAKPSASTPMESRSRNPNAKMNNELVKAWERGLPPFDGDLIRCEESIPWLALRRVSLGILRHIEDKFPKEPLFSLDDWHQHDGFGTDNECKIDLMALRVAFDDPCLLRSFCPGDFMVYRAIYPANMAFFWRFWLDAPEDCPDQSAPTGIFDFSCGEPHFQEVRQVIETVPGIQTLIEPAKAFFDRTWGG